MRLLVPVTIALLSAWPAGAMAPGCPAQHLRVVRSVGGVIDYLGTAMGLPALCRLERASGAGNYYFGVWRDDWPGAGQAYPALNVVLLGEKGTRADFITRSVPGLQWIDSFTNEGIETLVVGGETYRVLRIAHERNGIEGNSYHSIITSWLDVEARVTLKVVEEQISGQSYGPETSWTAVRVEKLP